MVCIGLAGKVRASVSFQVTLRTLADLWFGTVDPNLIRLFVVPSKLYSPTAAGT